MLKKIYVCSLSLFPLSSSFSLPFPLLSLFLFYSLLRCQISFTLCYLFIILFPSSNNALYILSSIILPPNLHTKTLLGSSVIEQTMNFFPFICHFFRIFLKMYRLITILMMWHIDEKKGAKLPILKMCILYLELNDNAENVKLWLWWLLWTQLLCSYLWKDARNRSFSDRYKANIVVHQSTYLEVLRDAAQLCGANGSLLFCFIIILVPEERNLKEYISTCPEE